MKAKVSRGAGFRGLLDYIYGPGEDNHPGRAVPVSGAGNVLGTDPRDLARQFAVSRQLRPDIKKPVWHCSLSLPPGEKLSDERWAEIARDFLSRMGLDPDIRMWHCARHIDTDHDHIHLVVSRVALDASSWGGGNDAHQAIDATQEMEKAHGLNLTPGFKEGGEKKSLSKGEVGRYRRTGKVPDRVILQKEIDAARKDCPDFSTFVTRLGKMKVQVLPNGKSGQVGGVSFRLVEGGDPFSGSSLGKAYKWQRISADTYFDADRDAELIARLRQEATAAEVAGGIGPAGSVQGERSNLYRGRGQVAPEKAREQYFQRQEDGSWTSRRSGWVAFREEENQIIVMSRRDVAIRAGLTTAAEKFGFPLEVSGEDEFRRKAWLLGSQMGLQIKGYEPTVEDLAELAAWREKHGGPPMTDSIRSTEQEVQPSYTLPAEDMSYGHGREHAQGDRGERVPTNAPTADSGAGGRDLVAAAGSAVSGSPGDRDADRAAAAATRESDGSRAGDPQSHGGSGGPGGAVAGGDRRVQGDSRSDDSRREGNSAGGREVPPAVGDTDVGSRGQRAGSDTLGPVADSDGTPVLRPVPPVGIVELSDFSRHFWACLAAEQAGSNDAQGGRDVSRDVGESIGEGAATDRGDHNPTAPPVPGAAVAASDHPPASEAEPPDAEKSRSQQQKRKSSSSGM